MEIPRETKVATSEKLSKEVCTMCILFGILGALWFWYQ